MAIRPIGHPVTGLEARALWDWTAPAVPVACLLGWVNMSEPNYIERSIRELAVPISQVQPDPANARSHSERNVEAIRASLAGFRQQTPIVIDAAGVCRKGNATLQAAKLLGWEHIAAVRTTLKGVEAIAYGIADNRTGDAEVGSDWDGPVLGDLLSGLRDEDYDHTVTGFNDVEIDRLIVVPDMQDIAPGSIEDQQSLDRHDPITCPHCGEQFERP